MTDTAFLTKTPDESLSAYVRRLEHEVSAIPTLETEMTRLTARLTLARTAGVRLQRLDDLLSEAIALEPDKSPLPAVPVLPEQATPADDHASAEVPLPSTSREENAQRISEWVERGDTSPYREYSPTDIGTAAGIERTQMYKALVPIVNAGLLVRLDHLMGYPTYALPAYLQFQECMLTALQGREPQNLAGVLELLGVPIEQDDAKYMLVRLATEGKLFIFTDLDDSDEETWFSLERPAEEVNWIVVPPSA